MLECLRTPSQKATPMRIETFVALFVNLTAFAMLAAAALVAVKLFFP